MPGRDRAQCPAYPDEGERDATQNEGRGGGIRSRRAISSRPITAVNRSRTSSNRRRSSRSATIINGKVCHD